MKTMLSNKQYYLQPLRKFGFVEQEYSRLVHSNQQSSFSDIMHRFNQDVYPYDSDSTPPSSRESRELMLESTVRVVTPMREQNEASQLLKKMCGDLSQLSYER
jgi:hypothetical protein